MTTLAPNVATLRGVPAPPQRRLWLITFVDLVMLLLAFFVLLFSMSSLDRPGYDAIARSYADVFRGGGGAADQSVGPLRVAPVVRAPGDDLAYLETVLRTNFAREAGLDAIQFRLTSQYLILMVPARMTAEGLDAATRSLFFELGGVLNNLPNRIAVVAPAIAGDDTTAWSAAATRAGRAQAALQSAGYQRPMPALVQGSLEEGASDGELPPVQVIVFPEKTPAGTEAQP